MRVTKSATDASAGLGRPILVWGVLFTLLAILTGLAILKGNQLERAGRETSQVTGKMRLLSQQMTTQALSASQGAQQSFLLLKQYESEFSNALSELISGSEDGQVEPLPPELMPELEQISGQWEQYSGDIDAILQSRESITRATQAAIKVQEKLPQLMSDSEKIADTLRKRLPSSGRQIYFATYQLAIAQKIQNNLNTLLNGGVEALSVADELSKNTERFSQVVDGMLTGNTKLGISRVSISSAREAITRVVSDFGDIADQAGLLVEAAPDLYQVKEVARNIEAQGRLLFEGTGRLEGSVQEYNHGNELWVKLGFALGILALLAFFMLLMSVYRSTRGQLLATKAANDDNQRAILTLLDEMSSLADGDLTVQATVTESITGAIADSTNYAIEALRSLVTAINRAASNVARTSRSTRETALRLSEASEEQARKIVSTSESISDLTDSINKVSQSAERSATVADQSLNIANKGVETVRRTIEGMDSIRENIQDTSKRIKRLGESSQEIGDIVGLITDIADQTNILALNAAIQASSAGEGGRGFAVVADEVQRLAERASNASKQIETLVKTIQADTNEAIQSMEKSTANVVSGAHQAKDAGHALEEIEQVSTRLAEFIKGISEEAREQSLVS
ncbi:MAG TPA: chemotaxis protein, partial [Gammaproteobacteria bacterium]|nr:chemotaxis protein [Gammaproteobacteria bacterium]